MFITNEDGINGIKEGYDQVFKNMHTTTIGFKEVIKMKNNGSITNRDLEICKFLFRFTFATKEQIAEFLDLECSEGDSNIDRIKERLDLLVKFRILNKFILSKDNNYKDKPNALEIYSLDLGGRQLLSSYSNEDTSDWYTVDTMKSAEIVKRKLYITRFYLKLKATSKDKISSFSVEPEMRVGKQSIIPSIAFSLIDNGKTYSYLCEVVLDVDIPATFRSNAFKLESLLDTNAWKKYYCEWEDQPAILLITESDFTALDSSRLIFKSTKLRRFRVTTVERIEKPLYESGVFMKYLDRTEELEAVSSARFSSDKEETPSN